MQKLQNEFASITNSPKEQNKFCRLFTEMTSIMDSKNDFQESIQYYNDLKNDNDEKLKILLDEKLVQMIESSEELYVLIVCFFFFSIKNLCNFFFFSFQRKKSNGTFSKRNQQKSYP